MRLQICWAGGGETKTHVLLEMQSPQLRQFRRGRERERDRERDLCLRLISVFVPTDQQTWEGGRQQQQKGTSAEADLENTSARTNKPTGDREKERVNRGLDNALPTDPIGICCWH